MSLIQNLNLKLRLVQQMDHLPFGNLVDRIALKIQNSPKPPVFTMKLSNE